MFERSRRKIVAAIMSVLVILFLGTLAVIYLSSYFEMRADNYQMLQRRAESYVLMPGGFEFGGMDDDLLMGGQGEKPFGDRQDFFQLSTFYSVALTRDGKVLAVDTGDRTLYDETTLCSYALSAAEKGRDRGVTGNLLYLIAEKNGYTLVVFMDNTIVQDRMSLLVRNTLIFGSGAIVAFFFLAVYLAKRIVKPLEESYQKQKQFISDAGHELKTPVSVVNTNADMLRREIGENQWLSNIQYENERMGLLVRQLLELARTETVSTRTEVLDFSRLTAGEALPFETVAFEKGLQMRTEIQPGLMVEGDSGKLKQLVSILIDNGIDHSSVGGEVAVLLGTDHNRIRLSVINDGPEIPPQQQMHLFERFYRADEARADDGHFGLGLAIAHAIAQSHKGKIGVRCENGKVEFFVQLPMHK